MRIAFSGTANTGKSTLIENFKMVWPSYTTPEKTYRDALEEYGLKHSKETSTETQDIILSHMIEQQKGKTFDDNILYDRCGLDALAYTLYAYDHNFDGFTKTYTRKYIKSVRESMRGLDIIFLLRPSPDIEIVDDGVREVDLRFIIEIDDILSRLKYKFLNELEKDVFFPKDDSPVIIELGSSPKERIETIMMYISLEDGGLIEEESVLDPNNIDEMSKLINYQETALAKDEADKKLFQEFGLAPKDEHMIVKGGITHLK